LKEEEIQKEASIKSEEINERVVDSPDLKLNSEETLN